MKFTPRFYQEGGAMEEAPVEEQASAEGTQETPAEGEAPQEGQDPMQQIVQMFAEGLQNQDCQLLAQGAQMFLQLVQQANGQGAPQEEQGQPVFRKGGVLAYRIKK